MEINGDLIITLYTESGYTQQEFADKAGMNRSVLSRLINRGTCRKSSLDKIAKALEVNPDMLLRIK